MTFTLDELQLMVRALVMAEGRLKTYARSAERGMTRGLPATYLRDADRLQAVRHKLSTFRARHDRLEVAQ